MTGYRYQRFFKSRVEKSYLYPSLSHDFSITFLWYYGARQAHCISVVGTKLSYLHKPSLMYPGTILVHVQHLIWLKGLYWRHECAYWNICIFEMWDQKALHKRQEQNKTKNPRQTKINTLSVVFHKSVSRDEVGLSPSKFISCGKPSPSLMG